MAAWERLHVVIVSALCNAKKARGSLSICTKKSLASLDMLLSLSTQLASKKAVSEALIHPVFRMTDQPQSLFIFGVRLCPLTTYYEALTH